MKIIGLTGKARAGKDTVAGFIIEWAQREGGEAVRYGFADKLKVSAAHALGFDKDREACVDFCNNLKAEGSIIRVGTPEDGHGYTITGRQFLQWYGTEAHRDVFGEDFWVEALMWQIEDDLNHSAGPDIAIITDVRFPNEAQAVNSRQWAGGEVWEVVRAAHADELRGGLEQTHASEVGVDPEAVKYKLFNGGTLDELRDAVFELCDLVLVQ